MSAGCIDGVLEEGQEYFVGGKEIELDCPISRDDYNSGRCFGVATSNSISVVSPSAVSAPRTGSKFVPPISRKLPKPLVERKEFVPLQPVSLASSSNTTARNNPEPERVTLPSYWTANW